MNAENEPAIETATAVEGDKPVSSRKKWRRWLWLIPVVAVAAVGTWAARVVDSVGGVKVITAIRDPKSVFEGQDRNGHSDRG